MKTRRLIVMRHAKSSWKSDAPTDHERPLNKRGRRDAPRIGAALEAVGWRPELVISSDSERTRETWSRMEEALGGAPEVRFTRALYHAGLDEVCDALRAVDEAATVMLLGHNPGWEEVVDGLAGEATTMTTANAALLEIDAASWHEAVGRPGDWRLVDVLRPKELEER